MSFVNDLRQPQVPALLGEVVTLKGGPYSGPKL
jgi:hypothetical protein